MMLPYLEIYLYMIWLFIKGGYRDRVYMLGADVFTLKFVYQHYIVNTAAPSMYTRPI